MFKKILKETLIGGIIFDVIICIIDGNLGGFFDSFMMSCLIVFLPILIYNLVKADKKYEKQKNIEAKQKKEENKNTSFEKNIEKEYRKKCNVCGNIFCYTDKDIEISNTYAELSNSNRKMGIQSKVGSLIGMNVMENVFNNDPNEKEKLAELYSNKVIDYSKCPKCGSSDIADFKPKKTK